MCKANEKILFIFIIYFQTEISKFWKKLSCFEYELYEKWLMNKMIWKLFLFKQMRWMLFITRENFSQKSGRSYDKRKPLNFWNMDDDLTCVRIIHHILDLVFMPKTFNYGYITELYVFKDIFSFQPTLTIDSRILSDVITRIRLDYLNEIICMRCKNAFCLGNKVWHG